MDANRPPGSIEFSSDKLEEPDSVAALPPSPPVEPSMWARFACFFSSPARAFAVPRGLHFWLFPMIVMGVVQGANSFLLADLYADAQLTMVESSPQLSEEQRSQLLEQLDSSRSNPGVQMVQIAVGVIGGALLTLALPAALLLAGINFGAGGTARFLDALGVLSLSSLLYVIREAITIPLKLSQGTLEVYTGPAALLEREAGLLFLIASHLDLFDLYRLFLVTVGFSIVGKVSHGRAVAVVLAFWGLFVILQIAVRLSPLGALTP